MEIPVCLAVSKSRNDQIILVGNNSRLEFTHRQRNDRMILTFIQEEEQRNMKLSRKFRWQSHACYTLNDYLWRFFVPVIELHASRSTSKNIFNFSSVPFLGQESNLIG